MEVWIFEFIGDWIRIEDQVFNKFS
ncbi:hypothetical protein CAEBREN_18748 [Caenorhabditis brenneri]|uniref:Uncharacterized protein n=1 Tax=Caenorhabditis brenneri TaxID=135651 RepID=G0NBU7_CAEBE|nr:hypothetical protein CAEBREN_18748 [Caenorhabditis brenneri]